MSQDGSSNVAPGTLRTVRISVGYLIKIRQVLIFRHVLKFRTFVSSVVCES